jgi:PAS domain S-box-containing protein
MGEENSALANRLRDLAVQQVGTHALVLLARDGKIVGWFAGAERMFGYRADEIVEQNASKLFTPEDLAKHLSAWEIDTATNSGESEDDRWQVRKDGGRIWVSGTLTAIRDEGGQLLGFAKIMRDRTDMKQQMESLISRIDALQQSDQRKNNFISTLAHELRNPLSAMSSGADLLEQDGVSKEDVEFAAGTIRRQVEFMNRMINDLLEVARAAAGKVQLHRERIVLQDVLRKAIETCRPTIDQRTHKLQQLFPDVPIELDGDPVRLGQVFVNLIENAGKYTEYGGMIWVKMTTEGNEAVVRVQDNGVGISPEVMPHIFDLFAQAEISSRAQSGLGIGLSVVKDVVTLHGGSVQATSNGLGKGSEFTVRLPLPSSKASK